MSHEHSEDDEGDEVGVGELEHPQQRNEDGLAGDVNDAADAVIVRILNGAPVKPVWIKTFKCLFSSTFSTVLYKKDTLYSIALSVDYIESLPT